MVDLQVRFCLGCNLRAAAGHFILRLGCLASGVELFSVAASEGPLTDSKRSTPSLPWRYSTHGGAGQEARWASHFPAIGQILCQALPFLEDP
jgi:hypothetical protein